MGPNIVSKIYEYIGYCVHRKSYLLGSPVIATRTTTHTVEDECFNLIFLNNGAGSGNA